MNFYRCVLVSLLVMASAAAGAQSRAQAPSIMTVDQITAEANRRAQAGESPDSIEAWMANAMQDAGIAVKRKPAEWDVYGMARWAQETAADGQDDAGVDPEQGAARADTIGGLTKEKRPDGNPTPPSGSDAADHDVRPEAAHGFGLGIRERSGGHAAQSRGPAITHHVNP